MSRFSTAIRNGWEGWAFSGLSLLVLVAHTPWIPNGGVVKWCLVTALAVLACLRVRFLDPTDILAIVIGCYAGFGVLWAPDTLGTVPHLWAIWACVAVFIYARRVNMRACIVTSAVWCWIGFEVYRPEYFAGFGNENFATIAFVAAFPFLVKQKRWETAVVAVWYLLFMNGSRLEFPAFGGWVVWWCLSDIKRRWWGLCVAAIGLLAAGYAVYSVSPFSWLYRADMWRGALMMFLDAPLLGHGVGSFEVLFPLYAPDAAILTRDVFTPGATHSDWLQLLAEFGIVGFLLVATLLWRCRGGGYVVAGLGAVALVDFPFQLPASAFLAVMALADGAGRPFRWAGYPSVEGT